MLEHVLLPGKRQRDDALNDEGELLPGMGMGVFAASASGLERDEEGLEPPASGHRAQGLDVRRRPGAFEVGAFRVTDDEAQVSSGREELSEGDIEGLRDLVERADRGRRLPVLDLGDEARGEAGALREGADRDLACLAEPPHLSANRLWSDEVHRLIASLILPRSWAGGPLLALATVLVGTALVAGAEMTLRWSSPAFLRDAPAERLHIYSEAYGWTHRPNWRGRLGDSPPITVNGAGRRGLEARGARRPGATRVLLLGDSIVFGAGVGDDQTFSQVLQEDGSVFETFNLGVSGYGTDQALLQLEREGFDLGPDVVVLNFCVANDYFDNILDTYLYDGRTPKPYFLVEGGELRLHDAHLKRPWLERSGLFLRDASYLFDALSMAAGSGLVMSAPGADRAPEHWQSRANRILLQDFACATQVTLRLIARMNEQCRRHGVRFVVLVHPDRRSFEGEDKLVLPLQDPRLEALEVVDLRRRCQNAGLSWPLVALDEVGHLNPRGHAFVAGVLRAALEARTAALF